MKRRTSIFLSLILLVASSAACTRLHLDEVGPEKSPELGLYLQVPGQPAATKGDVGQVPGTANEYALHSLKVWIFNSATDASGNHELVTFLDLDQSQFPTEGRVRRYAVPVSRDFASTKPNVDVFALANGESVGCLLDGDATWDQLNDAVFGDDWFGVENPVRTVNTTLGLPMTGVVKDVTPQGEEPELTIPTLKLTRAVSKLRYVFCRMKDDNMANPDSIRIERITLNGSLIPKQEYLFTTNAYSIVPGNYEMSPVYTPGPSYICRNETPERLVYANQDAASYEQMIDRAIADGVLSDCGVIYLRESNKILTGEVEYSINQETSSKTFNMAAPGDFARNHTWTLYGYFLSGRNLMLTTNVLPWDYSEWTVHFSNQSVIADQFSVDDTTAEVREPSKDHFDVYLIPGVTAKCHFYITAPVGGTVWIRPQGNVDPFNINIEAASIDPTHEAGRINVEISRNTDVEALPGQYMTLSFSVTLGEREIDANTEIFNGEVYRFIP